MLKTTAWCWFIFFVRWSMTFNFTRWRCRQMCLCWFSHRWLRTLITARSSYCVVQFSMGPVLSMKVITSFVVLSSVQWLLFSPWCTCLHQAKSSMLPTDVVVPLMSTTSPAPLIVNDETLASLRLYLTAARDMNHALEPSMQQVARWQLSWNYISLLSLEYFLSTNLWGDGGFLRRVLKMILWQLSKKIEH